VNWDSFLEQLDGWLQARGLRDEHGRWVVGVSGGPDSTLLLHALCDLSERRDLGWQLHVAHLHHGMRGKEADEDAQFVTNLAKRLQLPVTVERVDVPAEAGERGGSTEEVARERRYEFLERVALQTGSELVAVGHHADDDAETILHRICRGTGLRGLAGMSAVRVTQPGSRVRLVRPLLYQDRATIEELCRERSIEYRTDRTNLTGDYTRGRIRNVVLPMLREQLNPNVSDALLRLAEQARWLGTYLEDAAARVFDSLVIEETPQRVALNIHALLGKQRIIQAEVIRRAISLVYGSERDVGFHHIDAVLRLAADPASGKELHLPGNLTARKVYERLEFLLPEKLDAPVEIVPVFLTCPGVTTLPALEAEITTEICGVDREGGAGTSSSRSVTLEEVQTNGNPHEEWLDYERLAPPLFVRGRREGDRFRPLGAPGTKRLSDFLIDEKVEPALRSRTGVLCDQSGPVWVMPLRIDERVKLRPTSRRALHLVFHPTNPTLIPEP
jgi:tRNA(Ile)-lysidine synthase